MLYRKNQLVHHKKRSLLVTTEDQAEKIAELFQHHFRSIFLSGVALIDTDSPPTDVRGIPVIANAKSVIQYMLRSWVDEVFYCVQPDQPEYEPVLITLEKAGITIHLWLSDIRINSPSEVKEISDSEFKTISIHSIGFFGKCMKRFMDIVGSMIGSVIALLVMAVVAIPLKKQSPGPILYKSQRIGLNGRKFHMYKIRSMEVDADLHKADLMKNNLVKDGLMFKVAWDPRIIGNQTLPDGSHRTGIGAFIRNTFIDEFPQFFNVLKGNMSLVGTRPPTPDEWEKYQPHHRARMSVKPGITGMWQANGRSQMVDFEEVVKLDMEYIKQWSIPLDIKLILKTMVLFIKKIVSR